MRTHNAIEAYLSSILFRFNFLQPPFLISTILVILFQFVIILKISCVPQVIGLYLIPTCAAQTGLRYVIPYFPDSFGNGYKDRICSFLRDK